MRGFLIRARCALREGSKNEFRRQKNETETQKRIIIVAVHDNGIRCSRRRRRGHRGIESQRSIGNLSLLWQHMESNDSGKLVNIRTTIYFTIAYHCLLDNSLENKTHTMRK